MQIHLNERKVFSGLFKGQNDTASQRAQMDE